LPYVVWLVLFALAAAGVVRAPETRYRPSPLPAYRPQRVSVPRHARAQFFAALLGFVLVLATLGMFVALTGTFLATTLHHTSLALSGGTIFAVFGAGVAVTAATSAWPVRRLLATGIALMIAGLAVLVTAAWLPSPSLALFLAGGAIIGGGGAAGFRATLGIVAEISGRDKLAEVLAAYFLAGYVGMSVPVIGLGLALRSVSTKTALLGFAAVIAVALLAAAPALLRPQP
jgi:MFS family permease